MSKAGEQSSQQWTIYEDCSFRAGFLTAIAANTAAIIMFRWLGLVTFVPVNSLWFDGTHSTADIAKRTLRFINNRPLGYSILNESSKSATRTRHRGRSIYFKTHINEGLYTLAHKFNILNMVCSKSCPLTSFGCRYNFGIKIND